MGCAFGLVPYGWVGALPLFKAAPCLPVGVLRGPAGQVP